MLKGSILFVSSTLNYKLCTVDFYMLSIGLRTSINASTTPFRTASIIFPSSLTIMQSTVSCHTNLPVRMLSDSGSKQLLPMITFSSNFVISVEFFLFC